MATMEKEFFLKTLKEFFGKMGYGKEIEIDIQESKEEAIFVIKTEDAKYLIGEKGSNLASLEFMIKMACQKQNINTEKIFIDINDYRKDRANFLRDVARTTAQKVVATKSPIALFPMSSFDRKSVHSALASNSNIKTESVGFGEERKVLIRPILG